MLKIIRCLYKYSAKPSYLDFQATTPVDYRVLDAMLPYLTNMFGNPHSRTHQYGWESEKATEYARQQVARLINCSPQSIIFTSGATESNNTALKGLHSFYKKNHIITSQIEHKCVLDTCRYLEEQGVRITYLPVNQDGLIDPNQLEEAITPDTLCLSLMLVNNEIGVIQPIKELAAICHRRGVLVHSDIAQAAGKIPVDVEDLGLDLASISAHKLYGPKGIGALYIRRKPRVRIHPIISGGGQERGLRSGTLAPPLVVGFGRACEVAIEEMPHDLKHIRRLSHKLIETLTRNIPHIKINGSQVFDSILFKEHRYEGNVNVSFAYVEGESLLMAIKNCAVSSGSACTSSSLEPSYVLRALGVSEDMAHTSIRIGIGRFTTEEEIDFLASELIRSVGRLRELSPLWEMVQEGIDLSTIQWSQPH